DVIVVVGDRVIPILTKLTGSIPIVVALTSDPIASGAVESLARPGRNVTGFSVPAPPKLARCARHHSWPLHTADMRCPASSLKGLTMAAVATTGGRWRAGRQPCTAYADANRESRAAGCLSVHRSPALSDGESDSRSHRGRSQPFGSRARQRNGTSIHCRALY